MDITVKAKVLWITEKDLEDYMEVESMEQEPPGKFVWGPFTMPIQDIRYYWGQSKNRSVIEAKSGRHILVAMPHPELQAEIEKLQEALHQQMLQEAEADLVLGDYEEDEASESQDD